MTLRALSARLLRSDLLQLTTLLFVILLFSFVIVWPTTAREANDTWYALAQTRIVLLALLALGYGGAYVHRSKHDQRVTAAALLVLALLTSPLEVASYALSFPEANLVYALGVTTLDTFALYGIGAALGGMLSTLRLFALLPLAVPCLLVGFILVDVSLGHTFTNPLAALTHVSLWHIALMGFCALLTLLYLVRNRVETL